MISWNYHEIYNKFSPICSFCVCVCMYIVLCECVCVCVCVMCDVCVCTCTCVVFMYVAMCVNVCVCLYMCVCVCMYVCVCYINGFNFVAVMEGSHTDDPYACSTRGFTTLFKNHALILYQNICTEGLVSFIIPIKLTVGDDLYICS